MCSVVMGMVYTVVVGYTSCPPGGGEIKGPDRNVNPHQRDCVRPAKAL